MKKALFIGLMASTLFGCKEACVKDLTGTLTVKNLSADPYIVSLNGTAQGDVLGGSSKDFTIKAGAYALVATQKSGFQVLPTVKTGAITLINCQTTTYEIPQ